MRIKVDPKENTAFESLAVGDVFTCGGHFFMKIIHVWLGIQVNARNAVDLSTGTLAFFCEKDNVRPRPDLFLTTAMATEPKFE